MKKWVFFLCFLWWPTSLFAVTPVQTVTTEKGITFWLVEDHTVPVVSLEFAFEGGIALEKPNQSGLTNLLAKLLTQGVKGVSENQPLDETAFQKKLDDLAISLSFRNGRDYFHGSLKTLTENNEAAFKLLKRVLHNPLFDPESLSRQKQKILARIKQNQAEPTWLSWRNFNANYYVGHPYTMPGQGTEKTIPNLTDNNLRLFMQNHFVQEGLKIVLVGDITKEQALKFVDRVFGSLPIKTTPEALAIDQAEPKSLGEIKSIFLKSPQTRLLLGRPGVSKQDEDWHAAVVANYLIGGGGFASRLMEEVRSKKGLTYGVSSSLLTQKHSDLFVITLSTAKDKKQEALDVINQTLKQIVQDGFSQEEVDRAKTYLIGSQALALTSTSKMAGYLLNNNLDGLGIDYLDKRQAFIQNISLDDVNQAAAKILGDLRFLTIAVGEQ